MLLKTQVKHRHSSQLAKRVLVVDDSMYDLQLAEASLNTLGYESVCEQDAQKGLLIAKQEPLLAIILDLLMPNMDGFEFLYHYRQTKEGQETPVIIWTAKDLSDNEYRHLQTLVQGVVMKSTEPQQFLSEISHFLPASAVSAEKGW